MDNEILEELWQTRRNIEGKNGANVKRFLHKLRRKSKQSPSKYYFGKPRLLPKQKTA
jgi:hypothetical protein